MYMYNCLKLLMHDTRCLLDLIIKFDCEIPYQVLDSQCLIYNKQYWAIQPNDLKLEKYKN